MSSKSHNHNPPPASGDGHELEQGQVAPPWIPPVQQGQPCPIPSFIPCPQPHGQIQSPNNTNPPTVGYAVGSMIGHIWKAITTPAHSGPPQSRPGMQQPAQANPAATAVASPRSVPVHCSVQEQETISPDGRVILRRTTIEEVEIRQHPPEQGAGPSVQ